jgi:exonuclease III
MPDRIPEPDHELRIRQVNHNSSSTAHDSFINSKAHENYDIVLIQEPYINTLKKFSASPKWRVVYPSSHLSLMEKIRAITLVNVNMSTNSWHQVDVNDSNDMVAIQIEGPFGTASVINIYNDQNHSRTLARADLTLTGIQDSVAALPQPHDHYVVWAGDFNRHHPRWDEERNRQLFTARALEDAQFLIDILDERHLDMALPKDIPTLEFMGLNKNWTRPDNVFCSQNAIDVLVKCSTVPEQRGAGTDHVPIDARAGGSLN